MISTKNSLLCFFLLMIFPLHAQTEKVFMSGCGWQQVVLLDKATKQVEWSSDLAADEDCENITLTSGGNLLIAYKKGAKLINAQHQTIWDYPLEEPGELFAATQLPDGGFLLAHSGHPAKIIELDKKGQLHKTISFDTEVKGLHGQMRQLIKSKAGTYIFPIMAKGEVVELDSNGKEILRFKVEGNPFSVLEMKNGNLLVSCGDAHSFWEVERHSGKPIKKTGKNDVEGISLNFVAQIIETRNNTKLVCNWNGHVKGKEAEQPTLIEIDDNDQPIWQIYEGNGIGRISCVFQVDAEKVKEYKYKNIKLK